MSKTLCLVPYSQAFIRPDGKYRDCCSSTPHVTKMEPNFIKWWTGSEMQSLRSDLSGDAFPEQCRRCQQSESASVPSMRTVVGKDNKKFDIQSKYPNRYQIAFGNLCNLGCWSCEEHLSSVIQEEKRQLKILPKGFVDPQIGFDKSWPSLKEAMLASYDEHEEILINIWGGEPTISKDFVEFLELLVERGLSERTRIEMFTNCHSPKEGFQQLLKKNKWAHITILASIDAVGSAGEWIRYGSDWGKVIDNFDKFTEVADYLEVQCTLSVLSARHLPELKQFTRDYNVAFSAIPLQDPWFMSVSNWDGDMSIFGNYNDFKEQGLEKFWKLFGSTKRSGSSQALKDYINQFTNRNRSTNSFNPELDQLING